MIFPVKRYVWWRWSQGQLISDKLTYIKSDALIVLYYTSRAIVKHNYCMPEGACSTGVALRRLLHG